MKTQNLYFSDRSNRKLITLFCIIALLLGGMIYLFFRPSQPYFFHWIRVIGLGDWISHVRANTLSSGSYIPKWIINSLPNGLWAFAYAILITGIWTGSKSWLKYIWMSSIPILVLGYEFLQYPGVIPGTFCIRDIIFGTIGLLFGILIGVKTIKPYNYAKRKL